MLGEQDERGIPPVLQQPGRRGDGGRKSDMAAQPTGGAFCRLRRRHDGGQRLAEGPGGESGGWTAHARRGGCPQKGQQSHHRFFKALDFFQTVYCVGISH